VSKWGICIYDNDMVKQYVCMFLMKNSVML
jgi:hypothetical protein